MEKYIIKYEKKINKQKILQVIQYILFTIFTIINFYLVLCHETWRDETHAWTMAKYLSLKDLFIVSKWDGHPILWHLILMPFAKLNFPIITMQIISFLIITISAYLFVFHTRLNIFAKFIILFTVPFLYIYSSISRNYCLVVLLLVLIGIFYKKRYEHPLFYSILICLLINTHALSWGIVAGLTITFHINEIIKYIVNKCKRNYIISDKKIDALTQSVQKKEDNRQNKSINKEETVKIKSIFFGFILIVLNTLLVIYELYGTSNPDYILIIYPRTKKIINIFLIYIIVFFTITLIFARKNFKELFIVLCGCEFQIIVFTKFYGAILDQRYFMPVVLFLFLLILLQSTELDKKVLNIFTIIFIILNVSFGYVKYCYQIVKDDVNYQYSSCKEMADYINTNLSEESTVYTYLSIYCQSIEPYLTHSKLYDIYYDDYFENVKCISTLPKDANIDFKKCAGKYLITPSSEKLNFPIVYQTQESLTDEAYTLYYIN